MSIITPDFGILFWQTITFLTTLFVLSKYAWQPILDILKKREETVKRAVNHITEAQELIQQASHEKAKLIDQANLEREKIIDEALKTQQEILEHARQEGVKIKDLLLIEAKKEIKKEEQRAQSAIIKSAGVLAIQIAEKILMKELNQEKAQIELLNHLKLNSSPYSTCEHESL